MLLVPQLPCPELMQLLIDLTSWGGWEPRGGCCGGDLEAMQREVGPQVAPPLFRKQQLSPHVAAAKKRSHPWPVVLPGKPVMVVNAGTGAGNWNPWMLMGRMIDQGIVPDTISCNCMLSKDIHIKSLDLPTCYLR
jgi:hypothetical protein